MTALRGLRKIITTLMLPFQVSLPVVSINPHPVKSGRIDPVEKYRRTFSLGAPAPGIQKMALLSCSSERNEKLTDIYVAWSCRVARHIALLKTKNEDVLG